MTDHAPNLKLTEPANAGASAAFDDRQWRWAVRDSGLLADLEGSAGVLALHCYAMADLKTGQFDLPKAWTMEALAIGERTYRRARQQLERLGLIEDLGVSPTHPPNHRYRLCSPPTTPHPAAGSRAQKPVVANPPRSKLTGASPPGAAKIVQPPGQNCPPGRSNLSPQSAGESNGESSSSAPQSGEGEPPETPDPPPTGSLWHRPAYERAAAAALCAWGPFDWPRAHGLVTRYRPTRRQALHVLANAYAWRRAARKGEAPPIRDLAAFVKSEIQKGKFTLDDRVWQYRQLRRRRRKQENGRRFVAGPDEAVDRLSAERFAELLGQALERIDGEAERLSQIADQARRRHRERELVKDQLKREPKHDGERP